jgi:hypothetical protein
LAILVCVASVEDIVDHEVADFFSAQLAVFVGVGFGEARLKRVVSGRRGLAGVDEEKRGEAEGGAMHEVMG